MKGQANCQRPLCNFETNERREKATTAGKERRKKNHDMLMSNGELLTHQAFEI